MIRVRTLMSMPLGSVNRTIAVCRSTSSPSQAWRRLTSTSNKPSPPKEVQTETQAAADNDSLYLGTHLWRLACAFGFVYIFTEYGMELTICEGPSMLPTIRESAEIVVMDRFTPRWFGLQGGSNGETRAVLAKQQQAEHEKSLDPSVVPTWYQTRIPVNRLSTEGSWRRFYETTTSPISVGDVVVIQHPDRIGTVCKRVLALPGDVVTKPALPGGRVRRQRRPTEVIVPDGHIWVEGDNPANSSDSRNYGPVPASLIMGRVLGRVWPLRGNALMERGARPMTEHHPDKPHESFSGSIAYPAGYNNQLIVDFQTTG